jgi:hypothetical protein
MRRIRIAATAAIVATGLMAAAASPASAAKPINYGECVSNGVVSPADGIFGPLNTRGFESSDHRGGTVTNAAIHSDSRNRWSTGVGC